MFVNDKIKLKGIVQCWVRKKGGNWFLEKTLRNLVVDVGLNYIIERISGATSSAFLTHGGVGYGTTVPTGSDTALENEIIRKEFTNIDTGTSKQVEFTFNLAFNEGNTPGTITEIGLFTAESGGVMMCRVTFSSLTKDDNTERIFRWTLVFADA